MSIGHILKNISNGDDDDDDDVYEQVYCMNTSG